MLIRGHQLSGYHSFVFALSCGGSYNLVTLIFFIYYYYYYFLFFFFFFFFFLFFFHIIISYKLFTALKC